MTTSFSVLGLLLVLLLQQPNISLALSVESPCSRQGFLKNAVSGLTSAAIVGATSPCWTLPANAAADSNNQDSKLTLTDDQLREIVRADVVDRQFLVTANLTPSIYRPSATFTDEIDTYTMPKWIQGTQRLFVGDKSQVRLVGDVNVSPQAVEFQFDEDLCFNIPFKPAVALSGKVVLERDESGFITSYREFWDQDVATVLKTAKFK